ncbi:zinc-dependent alcohol dehydrogenase [Natrialbaceae archaeon A-CW3]
MQSVVQTGAKSLQVGQVSRPSIEDDQVLVKVRATGVCGSDAHAYLYDGGYEWVELPRIMGHEYAGEIVELGSDVTSVSVGDRVVENPTQTCGVCFQCNNGQSNVCQNFSVKGMHRDGSYAEYTVADPHRLHIVPDAVPLEHAAITEPLSIATRAVFSQSNVVPGDTVLVEGPGPIGVLVAAVADSIGCRVLVSGLERDNTYRLPLIERLGIETALIDGDLESKADELTDGVGFDVIFDTTGHYSGIEYAVELVRKGGQIVVVGLPGGESSFGLAPVVRGEISISTSYGSKWENFEQALTLMENGTIDPGEIIDRSYSVSEPEKAFSAFLESDTCKPIFTFEDSST